MKKKFYTDELFLCFDLDRNQELSGYLSRQFENIKNLQFQINGLYEQTERNLNICFFIELEETLTCYSGKIFKYSSKDECLWLRFLPISKLLPAGAPLSDSKQLFLFDCPKKNPAIETRKVIDFIPEDIFV